MPWQNEFGGPRRRHRPSSPERVCACLFRLFFLLLLLQSTIGHVAPSWVNTSHRPTVIIHAWVYGVRFDTLFFLGGSGGTSLGSPCVFHPTSTGVPGPLAHRCWGRWPWQGHRFGMRPSPLSPWGRWRSRCLPKPVETVPSARQRVEAKEEKEFFRQYKNDLKMAWCGG